MRFKDLQKKSPEDIKKERAKIHLELMKLRAQVATGGAGKEAGKIKTLKRTIAKINTLESRTNKEVKSKR